MKKLTNLLVISMLVVMVEVLLYGEDGIKGQKKYYMIDLGDLGASGGQAFGINNNGQITGYNCCPAESSHRAFLWSQGSVKDLGSFEGTLSGGSIALGINDKGEIVGTAGNFADVKFHAFSWSNGSMQDLGTLGGRLSEAFSVNSRGQVVGYSHIDESINGPYVSHAFLWSDGTMQDLGTLGGLSSSAVGINDHGDIVGYSYTATLESRAFLWSHGSMRDLGTLDNTRPGFSSAQAINNRGQIVGSSSGYSNNIGFIHAFMWSDGVMRDLGTLGDYSDAIAINNNGEIIGNSRSIDGSHQLFIYSGNTMKNLNELCLNPIPDLFNLRVTAINDNGQIVGYGTPRSGQIRAVLWNPVALTDVEAALGTQIQKKEFGNYPTKEEGKDSLVVVTHGWQPFLLNLPVVNPPNVSWIDEMSEDVRKYVNNQGLTNWQVYPYKWVENAWKIASNDALYNAREEGANLGSALSVQGWKHVHLIGHSVGARLIQEAAEWIKLTSPSTTVHCTFLDPDVGNDNAGVKHYGKDTDWSDCYYVDDFITFSRTAASLENAYNVDVKLLDSVRNYGVSRYVSSDGGVKLICHTVGTSHQWPRYFYTNTIVGNTNLEYRGFGFTLSKEGGNWDYALTHFPKGNIIPEILGTIDCDTPSSVSPYLWPNQTVDFVNNYSIQSTTGSLKKWFGSIELYTGSPVWSGTLVTLTNPVNTVSFDLVFNGTTNSDSLFSVYWDTNIIGTIQEKYVRSGSLHYSFTFPQAIASSSYLLGFRLDPYTNALSSVALTNIVLSQIGVSQPFSLSLITNALDRSVFNLKGESGFGYVVQVSTNLLDWADFAELVNTNGSVSFYDDHMTNSSKKFYRAIVPRRAF